MLLVRPGGTARRHSPFDLYPSAQPWLDGWKRDASHMPSQHAPRCSPGLPGQTRRPPGVCSLDLASCCLPRGRSRDGDNQVSFTTHIPSELGSHTAGSNVSSPAHRTARRRRLCLLRNSNTCTQWRIPRFHDLPTIQRTRLFSTNEPIHTQISVPCYTSQPLLTSNHTHLTPVPPTTQPHPPRTLHTAPPKTSQPQAPAPTA